MSNEINPKYDFQEFLKDNLPLLTIIGVFAALSKFFLDTNSPNAKLLSEFSLVLTIFLLIIFGLVTIIHLLKRLKSSINAGFVIYTRSSINDIIIALFGFFIIGIVVTMIQILGEKYSIDIQLIFLSIGIYLGILISLYAGAYILLKVYEPLKLLGLLLIYLLIFGTFIEIFDLSHNLFPLFQPLSPLAPLYGIVVINTIIFPLIILKLVYHGIVKDILSKCYHFLKPYYLDIRYRFYQFLQKYS